MEKLKVSGLHFRQKWLLHTIVYKIQAKRETLTYNNAHIRCRVYIWNSHYTQGELHLDAFPTSQAKPTNKKIPQEEYRSLKIKQTKQNKKLSWNRRWAMTSYGVRQPYPFCLGFPKSKSASKTSLTCCYSLWMLGEAWPREGDLDHLCLAWSDKISISHAGKPRSIRQIFLGNCFWLPTLSKMFENGE